MQIHATFIRRKHEPREIELIHAWDSGSVDENPEGFHETRTRELVDIGTDLLDSVQVTLNVDRDAIMYLFDHSTVLDTTIASASKDTTGDER